MGISGEQKLEIKRIIKDAILKKIREYELIGDAKPFHEKLFSKDKIRETSFFHSCSTTIGVTLFQNIAYLIAKEKKNFKRVEKQWEIKGNFSNQAKTVIEDIIYDLGRKQKDPKKRRPNIRKEIQEVIEAASLPGSKSAQIADLFIINSSGNEIYIEIKTIKPNKGESSSAKRGMLKIVALRNKPVTVFVGMGYNPYEPGEYVWPLPLSYLKIGEDLIIGRQFWDFLGGEGTYEDLLNVFEQAGLELYDEIDAKMKEIGRRS